MNIVCSHRIQCSIRMNSFICRQYFHLKFIFRSISFNTLMSSHCSFISLLGAFPNRIHYKKHRLSHRSTIIFTGGCIDSCLWSVFAGIFYAHEFFGLALHALFSFSGWETFFGLRIALYFLSVRIMFRVFY